MPQRCCFSRNEVFGCVQPRLLTPAVLSAQQHLQVSADCTLMNHIHPAYLTCRASSSSSKVTDLHLQQRSFNLSLSLLSFSSHDSLSLTFTSCLSSAALLHLFLLLLVVFSDLSPSLSLSLSVSGLCPLSPASLLLPSLKPQAWPGPMASLGWTHPAAWLAWEQRDAPILGQKQAGLR